MAFWRIVDKSRNARLMSLLFGHASFGKRISNDLVLQYISIKSINMNGAITTKLSSLPQYPRPPEALTYRRYDRKEFPRQALRAGTSQAAGLRGLTQVLVLQMSKSLSRQEVISESNITCATSGFMKLKQATCGFGRHPMMRLPLQLEVLAGNNPIVAPRWLRETDNVRLALGPPF
ncbi:hypothetical protein BDZ45DRAFT_810473 [Acephala macrosclerotiorum]|nr:hypothetical protein BDZ45DRAFT_810473 [Acephala macrosclerotiorum]